MKTSDFPGPDATWAEVVAFRATFDKADARRSVVLEDVRQRVLAALPPDGQKRRTVAQVAEAVGMGTYVVRAVLRKLRARGLAASGRGGWRRAPPKPAGGGGGG